jgi:hypothetical protein
MTLKAPVVRRYSLRERLHHRLGWLGIVLLILPMLSWVWLAACEPVKSVFNGAMPHYLLSGKVFSEKFNTVHAGFVLDQPTIGKWLFWFSVMAMSSLPYAMAVGWLADRETQAGRLAYGIGATVLAVFLLCIVSWPLLWLIQYVWSMGFTPKRAFGLVYAVGGGLLVIGFLLRAWRNPARNKYECGHANDYASRG